MVLLPGTSSRQQLLPSYARSLGLNLRPQGFNLLGTLLQIGPDFIPVPKVVGDDGMDVGQQQRDLRVAGLRGMQGGEFRGRLRNPARLVEGEREVPPDPRISRAAFQRFPILDDGFFVTPRAGECGTEIRSRIDMLGPLLQVRAIFIVSVYCCGAPLST